MLALGWLVLLTVFGDAISRRFFRYVSTPHRVATAFLVGLLVGTWLTHLAALAFMTSDQPLVAGNLIAGTFMAAIAGWGLVASRRWSSWRPAWPRGSERGDWVVILALGVLVAWMVMTTMQHRDGQLLFGVHEYGDLAPNTAIAQSFAVGHNYPPEYPFFANAPILYHYLYYFGVGNLSFLGLDPALANNLPSVGSLVALLVLVMAFGQRVFGSPLVGRMAAVFFFFHGALSFIPWLASFGSPGEAVAALDRLDHYLSSGLPYHGEDWATWTMNVYLNQRHLASAIGIVLVAVLFIVDRLQEGSANARGGGATAVDNAMPGDSTAPGATRPTAGARVGWRTRIRLRGTGGLLDGRRDRSLGGYAAVGLLLGMLPFWNAPMYVASAAIFAVLFFVFRIRVQLTVLAVAAAVIGLPQILLLRPANVTSAPYPALHWGYVVTDPTPWNVLAYVGFIFGPKLLLVAVAVVLGTSVQRRLLLAVSSLFVLPFVVQLSTDIAASHKFFNAWLVMANPFAAYGLVRLWQSRAPGRMRSITTGATRLVAVATLVVILVGGAIDLVPIRNNGQVSVRLAGDRLYEWLQRDTDPRAIFLSDLYIVHPIPLAGRRLYYGWPVYAWSAGYDTGTRDREYRELFGERSPRDLVRELQENRIAYVAVDDGLRSSTFIPSLSEELFATHLERVFDDVDNHYGHLAIYRVPSDPTAWQALPGAPPVDAFTGGLGNGTGEFDGPRGLAIGPDDAIVVADTGNHRIQRFDGDGTFVAAFGEPGQGDAQLAEPNGVAVDARGHVFVADTMNHRLQEFDSDGAFVRAWNGPEPGFYGPRDVAVDAEALYVLDQGRARVVRQAVDGTTSTFGSLGNGPGQLNDPTGIAVADGLVFVADPTNARIQVFEADGAFVRSEPVAAWRGGVTADVAVDAVAGRVYASGGGPDILVFDIAGGALPALAPGDEPPGDVGALALTDDGVLLAIDRRGSRVARIDAATR